MIYFSIPDDPRLLAAIAKVAITHGQLDLILKMTIKTLTNVTPKEARDATEFQSSRELRQRVKKLAKKRLGESDTLVRLEALLTRSRRATERRNALLHGIWAQELDGDAVHSKNGDEWAPPPKAEELETLAEELTNIANELNAARLEGFLKEALERSR
jgi:hypothetical protein